MSHRHVMTMRLSPTWVNQELSAIRHLAMYLYSFYRFLHLNDPASEIGWAIGIEHGSGIPYLIILELIEDQGDGSVNESKSLKGEWETDLEIQSGEGLPDDLTEEDLAPELREER